MEKDGPLDGRKYNKNNKDSQMGQVTPKKKLNVPVGQCKSTDAKLSCSMMMKLTTGCCSASTWKSRLQPCQPSKTSEWWTTWLLTLAGYRKKATTQPKKCKLT